MIEPLLEVLAGPMWLFSAIPRLSLLNDPRGPLKAGALRRGFVNFSELVVFSTK